MARLSGQSADLLSYEDVVQRLGVNGQSSLGVQQIPLTAIVGSVGRYEDFSRTFLPRLETDEDRWASVATAAKIVTDLPPIDVYKIDESYFVLDGNHRVSIARRQGIDFIDAYVTEIRTRVPLPPGGRPDDLIIAAEYADFLAYTQLDKQREDIDLRVTVPGQYAHLENHIEAHRFWIETHADHEIAIEAAAARWYDDAYLPLVQAVREQGVLRYFPGRTETDFFIWLSRHRAELQNELKTIIAPEVAVARITPRVEDGASEPLPATAAARLRRRLARLFVTDRATTVPLRRWTDDRRIARYSDRLFANIMWPVCIEDLANRLEASEILLNRAVMPAVEEDALLWVLAFHCSPATKEMPGDSEFDLVEKEIAKRREEFGLAIHVQAEFGDPIRKTLELAYLTDLIVLSRDFNAGASGSEDRLIGARTIISRLAAAGNARRPLWILGESQAPPIVERVLLVYHGQTNSEEALFIAAYLSERWRVELLVLPVDDGHLSAPEIAHATDYLSLHELETVVLPSQPAAIPAIMAAAQDRNCDMIIIPLSVFGRIREKPGSNDALISLLTHWPHPVLLAG